MKPNIIDLFSGLGGLSLGFEMAGFKTLASVDHWKDAIETLNHNSKNKSGIATTVANFNRNYLSEIVKKNEINGVIGGPPCQGFSTARHSDTSNKIWEINKERNFLYLDFCETVKLVNPDFFVIENVKGLKSSYGGKFVEDIEKRFKKRGYEVSFEVLNAADFGVPQSRQRIFFVGLRKQKFIFPNASESKISSSDAISDLENSSSKNIQSYTHRPKNDFQQQMRGSLNYVKNHEITNHSDKTKKIIGMVPDGGNIHSLPAEYWEVRKFNKAFQRMNSSSPSNTIDTGHRNYFHYKKNRIPTARESARIQSFPDCFEILGSKGSQYKQIGNAVPPLLARALGRKILEQIQ